MNFQKGKTDTLSNILIFFRFLLLPAFLGDLFLRQMTPDRLTILNISKVYCRSGFLQVMENLESDEISFSRLGSHGI